MVLGVLRLPARLFSRTALEDSSDYQWLALPNGSAESRSNFFQEVQEQFAARGFNFRIDHPLSFDMQGLEDQLGYHITLNERPAWRESLAKLEFDDKEYQGVFEAKGLAYFNTLSEWVPSEARRMVRSLPEMLTSQGFCRLHTRSGPEGVEVQVGLVVLKGSVKLENEFLEDVHITLAAHWLTSEEHSAVPDHEIEAPPALIQLLQSFGCFEAMPM